MITAPAITQPTITRTITRIAAATIVKAKLTGMLGNLEQSEAYALQAERLGGIPLLQQVLKSWSSEAIQ